MRTTIYCGLLVAMLAAGCTRKHALVVTVRNVTELTRTNETVEIPWHEVTSRYPGWAATELTVTDSGGFEIPSQLLPGPDADTPRSIIFQATTAPGATSTYLFLQGEPSTYSPGVTGRLVPERRDDFAWENTLVAFRVYGPALEATGEISNGMDTWVKSTPRLVMDELYAAGDYHRDHGDGLDCYKVGRTLGAGAMAPLVNDSLVLGNNFVTSRILDKGPIRLTFELTYAPYAVGDSTVTETRVITLDAGSRFNRVEMRYENAPAMEVAAGIVLREGEGTTWMDAANGVVAYWEPRNTDNNDDNGHTAVAVLFPGGMKAARQVAGHVAGIADHVPGEPFVYHAGVAWSKGGVPTPGDWQRVLSGELTRLGNPLEVTITKK
jgi:hypothetical protein